MTDAPLTGIVLVAAGSGTRLGSDVPKAFVPIAGRPILSHALERVLDAAEPLDVVVVVPAGMTEEAGGIVAETAGPALSHVRVVEGGATRQESVALGLRALDAEVGIVLVHDAARALAPSRLVDDVAAAVRERGVGVVPVLAVADTVKQVDGERVVATVDRSVLRAVQTPQGFPRAMIESAYATAEGERTDDAALVAEAGHPVVVVPGSDDAVKITTPWDLRRAERSLARVAPARSLRTGTGVDVHAYDAGRELRLACLSWPGEPGLAGHSDGDAVAHAVTDALLSAAGLGDIGGVFGTDDPRYDGASGEVFLRATVERLREAGLGVVNVSVQVIGERPRLSRRREEAQERLGAIIGAPVSVAGTTSDGLGFTGRGEGLCALATALVAPLDQ